MADEHTSAETGGARTRVRFRRRAIVTGLVGLVSVALLLLVARPDEVIDQIGSMSLSWVLAAVGFELLSCVSYVVLFRRFFAEPSRSTSRQVAWVAMGAGAVLPGGNISSAAATGWLLRTHGIGTRALVERCASLLCFLTGFGFLLNGFAGVLLLLGVPGGPHDLAHTAIPILVSVAVLGSAALVMISVRRFGRTVPRPLRGVATGLEGGWSAVRAPHWRLFGAAGFTGLDIAALWAACAATGHPLGFLAVIIAYCIGYLATALPMPAGLGVLDSGLAGALVLYHFSPAAAVSAVLVYHAIAIWVPGLGGLLAWLPTRRRAYERAHERAGGRAGERAPLVAPGLAGWRPAPAAETDT